MKVRFDQPGTLDIQHAGDIDLTFTADEPRPLAAWEKEWEITSFTDPGTTYIVTLDLSCPPKRQWACTCPSWDEFKRPECKHVKHVQEGLRHGLMGLLSKRAISPHLVDQCHVEGTVDG